MKSSNLVKGRIGINKVATVVENLWDSGWQEYAAQNDDAFDGVIIMKRGLKNPAATGGLIFVQVKCGSGGYKQLQDQYPDHIGIALGAEYVAKHVPRWMKASGPAILVFVDDETSKENPAAYWTDLKRQDSYSPTNQGMVLVPKHQRFSHHTKGEFHRLCGSNPADQELQEVRLERRDGVTPGLGKHDCLRKDAWNFYATWKSADGFDVNPALGQIIVNRVGWEHMTRASRLPERVSQSWLLLGAAKKMIAECVRYWTLGHATERIFPDGTCELTDYLALRAKVSFPYRHHSVVQVILRRSRIVDANRLNMSRQKIWFYSVHELRRGTLPA